MAELGSAAIPAVGADDHARGEGPEAVVYVDLACPHCAATWGAIRELPLRLCVRHFPMAAKHKRAPMLHGAAEAAARQRGEAFWEMVDSIYADQSHQDDPHLWERVERLGLDVERFDADRRSAAVGDRVRRDFQSGVRAGVTGTPAAFIEGRLVLGLVKEALEGWAWKSRAH